MRAKFINDDFKYGSELSFLVIDWIINNLDMDQSDMAEMVRLVKQIPNIKKDSISKLPDTIYRGLTNIDETSDYRGGLHWPLESFTIDKEVAIGFSQGENILEAPLNLVKSQVLFYTPIIFPGLPTYSELTHMHGTVKMKKLESLFKGYLWEVAWAVSIQKEVLIESPFTIDKKYISKSEGEGTDPWLNF